jgi:ABC-type sugar transport system ATPase subunit
MQVGIGYVPSERKTEGLFLELSTGENIVAASLPRFSRAGLFDKNATLETAKKHISRLHIKTSGAHERCGDLSGGNQQKVLIAKWLETRPRLLIIDEPTKGIDIAAKSEIHYLLRKLADGGTAIIFISSDLPETLTLADRVLVMHNGNLVADLGASSTSEREITALASGMTDKAA